MTPDAPPVLEAHRLAVGYGDVAVVRDVDLRVVAGEAVAVMGANGSGKTTLMRGLLGLATVMGGELRLLGVPAARFTDRARIGYVPQRHALGTGTPATVREVVATGRLARRGWLGRTTAADRTAVAAAIEAVALEDRPDASVHELSGGQQRRVLIARALASEPDVLVMDEPTAGVDVASQEAFAVTLARLAGLGSTLLVVTHELGPLRPVLDRAVVIRGGTIAYDGPTTGLGSRYAHDHAHHDEDPEDPAAPGPVTGLDHPLPGQVRPYGP